MRIITGKHKNRKILTALKGNNAKNFRPSTEKTREAIFNIINSTTFEIENFMGSANVLDLFCGSGALGLEALSRGAKFVTFIDKEPSHIAISKQNVENFNELTNSEFIVCDATKLKSNHKKYNLILLDPPYNMPNIITSSLKALEEGNWIDKQNFIIIEHARRDKFVLSPGYEILSSKVYGSSALTICRFLGHK